MAKLKNAHALLIGVGSEDLPETINDAKTLYEILANKETGSYYKSNVKILTGKKATRRGILKAFDNLLERTDEDSSVLLFYSGHGGMYSDNTFIKDEALKKPEVENQKYFHLCPYDYKPKKYKTTWIKAEEIKFKISQLKSQRLIFFLDCCHAAGMTAGVTGRQPKHTNADGLAQNLDDGRGMIIISACRAEELSVILEGEENSLFTQCMIEVLRGDDKHEGQDAFVRIFEVVNYIFNKIKEIYPKQNPYANIQIFDNFVLSFASKLMGENANEVEIEALVEATKATKKKHITKFRETENSNSAILFVHGFSGDAENTFLEAPKLLMTNSEVDGWDMFPLGYSGNIVPEMGKNIWACASDIKRNSDFLNTSIRNKFSKYSNGLPEIQLENFFTYGNDEKELKEGSPYMKRLRNAWDEKFQNEYPFIFKTIAATRDEFVPISSSLEPFPKKYHEIIDGDHFSIVQIKNKDDDGFQAILKTLTNQSFLNKFSNKEEINIAMGEYKEVVSSLFPKLKYLDNKGLERLVYALEAGGREEEAMKILKEHPAATDNSNLLGIMGGRYKRQYLKTYLAEDLRKAFKHYGDALKISEENGDASQIYYHAINLAFLSLMKRERGDMTTFADKAFQATEKDPFPSLWKFATMGEAFLYKGDFDNSKENYGKAAEMAGLREKISIHANAYNAYVSLMQTDNPEDSFIKFLKINFLS